jgi:hypothetical protein
MGARWLEDDCGHISARNCRLEGCGVVGRDHRREVADRLGHAGRRAGDPVIVDERAHHVGPAVEVLIEHHDAIAPRGSPCDPEREHPGLCARRSEPDFLRRGDERGDELGPLDLKRMRGAVVDAPADLLAHCLHDCRVRMAKEQRAVTHRVVDELGAVDEPFARSARACHVDTRVVGARGVGGAAGEDSLRALGQVGMAGGAHGLINGHGSAR